MPARGILLCALFWWKIVPHRKNEPCKSRHTLNIENTTIQHRYHTGTMRIPKMPYRADSPRRRGRQYTSTRFISDRGRRSDDSLTRRLTTRTMICRINSPSYIAGYTIEGKFCDSLEKKAISRILFPLPEVMTSRECATQT